MFDMPQRNLFVVQCKTFEPPRRDESTDAFKGVIVQNKLHRYGVVGVNEIGQRIVLASILKSNVKRSPVSGAPVRSTEIPI